MSRLTCALDNTAGDALMRDAMATREPYDLAGARSVFAHWSYARDRGTWKVSVDAPNVMRGEPYDGSMVGCAVCDDFGVLRVIGGLS